MDWRGRYEEGSLKEIASEQPADYLIKKNKSWVTDLQEICSDRAYLDANIIVSSSGLEYSWITFDNRVVYCNFVLLSLNVPIILCAESGELN